MSNEQLTKLLMYSQETIDDWIASEDIGYNNVIKILVDLQKELVLHIKNQTDKYDEMTPRWIDREEQSRKESAENREKDYAERIARAKKKWWHLTK